MKNYLAWLIISLSTVSSCQLDELSNATEGQMAFPKQLSDYHIYQGVMSDLVPSNDYKLYLLGSTLFTDYANKQRLIKVPAGFKMEKIDDGLPAFPNGTVIIKTFFYYHDKRDTSKGKRVIETRLLVKQDESWHVADYLWNEEQNDATLIEDGLNTTVNYINELGEPKVLAYHIPSNRECATCHSTDNELIPIGPKLRNLNVEIETRSGFVNQIEWLQDLGMLSDFDRNDVTITPDFNDKRFSMAIRTRAYLDANCGHCHNQSGFAADTDIFLDYEHEAQDAELLEWRDDILENMNGGKMPFLGTSVVDTEGIALIKNYLNSL